MKPHTYTVFLWPASVLYTLPRPLAGEKALDAIDLPCEVPHHGHSDVVRYRSTDLELASGAVLWLPAAWREAGTAGANPPRGVMHLDGRHMESVVPIYRGTGGALRTTPQPVGKSIAPDDFFDWQFELGETVELLASGESGRVIGRSEHEECVPMYQVRYKAATGQAVEAWWSEEAIRLKPADFGSLAEAASAPPPDQAGDPDTTSKACASEVVAILRETRRLLIRGDLVFTYPGDGGKHLASRIDVVLGNA